MWRVWESAGLRRNEAEELNRRPHGLRRCLIATDAEMSYCFWTIRTTPPPHLSASGALPEAWLQGKVQQSFIMSGVSLNSPSRPPPVTISPCRHPESFRTGNHNFGTSRDCCCTILDISKSNLDSIEPRRQIHNVVFLSLSIAAQNSHLSEFIKKIQ